MDFHADLPQSPPPFSPQGSGCLKALLVLAGGLLLLPGGCMVLVFVLGYITHPEPAFFQPRAWMLLGTCLLASAFGIALIRWATKRRD